MKFAALLRAFLCCYFLPSFRAKFNCLSFFFIGTRTRLQSASASARGGTVALAVQAVRDVTGCARAAGPPSPPHQRNSLTPKEFIYGKFYTWIFSPMGVRGRVFRRPRAISWRALPNLEGSLQSLGKLQRRCSKVYLASSKVDIRPTSD